MCGGRKNKLKIKKTAVIAIKNSRNAFNEIRMLNNISPEMQYHRFGVQNNKKMSRKNY
jgi:hypothetical protein